MNVFFILFIVPEPENSSFGFGCIVLKLWNRGPEPSHLIHIV